MKGSTVRDIFSQKVRTAFSFVTYYFLVKLEFVKVWFIVISQLLSTPFVNLEQCPIVFLNTKYTLREARYKRETVP